MVIIPLGSEIQECNCDRLRASCAPLVGSLGPPLHPASSPSVLCTTKRSARANQEQASKYQTCVQAYTISALVVLGSLFNDVAMALPPSYWHYETAIVAPASNSRPVSISWRKHEPLRPRISKLYQGNPAVKAITRLTILVPHCIRINIKALPYRRGYYCTKATAHMRRKIKSPMAPSAERIRLGRRIEAFTSPKKMSTAINALRELPLALLYYRTTVPFVPFCITARSAWRSIIGCYRTSEGNRAAPYAFLSL